jgi:CDP-diglyceride synthetase
MRWVEVKKRLTFWSINPRKDWVDFIVCVLGSIILLVVFITVIVHFYTNQDIAPAEFFKSKYYSL